MQISFVVKAQRSKKIYHPTRSPKRTSLHGWLHLAQTNSSRTNPPPSSKNKRKSSQVNSQAKIFGETFFRLMAGVCIGNFLLLVRIFVHVSIIKFIRIYFLVLSCFNLARLYEFISKF